MSLLSNLAELFTSSAGGSQGSRSNESYHGETDRICRLCEALGWSVDEREGNKIRLHFKDKLTGIRKVYLFGGDDSLVTFMVFSDAILPQDEVPHQIIGHLLRQNRELGLGAWQVYVDEEDDALFSLRYSALGDGLTPSNFQYICEQLLAEAAGFDKKMYQAGLLSLR